MPCHTTSDQYGSQGDVPTTLVPWAWTAALTTKNLKMRYLKKPSWMNIGFLADLELASINDEALNKLPGGTANLSKEGRGKSP